MHASDDDDTMRGSPYFLRRGKWTCVLLVASAVPLSTGLSPAGHAAAAPLASATPSTSSGPSSVSTASSATASAPKSTATDGASASDDATAPSATSTTQASSSVSTTVQASSRTQTQTPSATTTQLPAIAARAALALPSIDGRLSSLYSALGGAGSFLGEPTASASALAGGICQQFQGGIVYWSAATGAAALHGAVLAEYQAIGGPTGQLGWPMTDEIGLSGGVYQQFQGGKIYWTSGTGAHAVAGAFLPKYAAEGWRLGVLGWPTSDFLPLTGGGYQQFQGGTLFTSASGTFMVRAAIGSEFSQSGSQAGVLGYPTSDEIAIPSGVYQQFQNGRIYWSYTTGAHAVHTGVLAEFLALDGTHGTLGYPTSDETPSTGGGVYQNFQGGAILWSPSSGAHVVHAAIQNEWLSQGGAAGILGYPTSDEIAIPSGVYQQFQNGRIYWSYTTGAHAVHTGVLAEFLALDGTHGTLGFPTSDEVHTVNGGVFQNFQSGAILWSPSSGAHTTPNGAIRDEWLSQGFEAGHLGFPTSDVSNATNNGLSQSFQGGAIYWSPSTGAHVVHAAIQSEWLSQGGATGILGYPTSDEIAIPSGVYQQFQNGRIYWSYSTGAHTIHAAIQNEFLALNGMHGYLGYPTSDETPTTGGGVYQNFQGGAILWSPSTGAHTVHGAIRTEWLSQGYEAGYLGYPTSDETPTTGGGVYQNFQGGVLYWSPGDDASALSSSQLAMVTALTNAGFSNADALVRAANDTGLPVGIAAALIAMESMGQNVYGHDVGGTMSGAGQVTQQNFTQQFLPAVLNGATSNGVGPCQITYSGYFRQNPNMAWWDPYTNMVFGFTILSGYLNGNYSDAGLIAAGSTYNSGSATGNLAYGTNFDQLAVTYTQLLS